MRIGNKISWRVWCYLAVKLGKGKGKSLPFSGVHRVTRTHVHPKKCIFGKKHPLKPFGISSYSDTDQIIQCFESHQNFKLILRPMGDEGLYKHADEKLGIQ